MNTSEKRQAIIEKAFELIYLQGYHGTGVNEIVTAVGIPKGSFYYYFKTKENLVVETIQHYTTLVVTEMNMMMNDVELPPLERIKQLYRNRLNRYETEWNCSYGCFAGNLSLEVGDTNEVIRQALDQFFLTNRQPIVKLLEEAQKAEQLNHDYVPEELAESIVNSFEGALLRMKTTKTVQPLHIFLNTLDIILVV